MIPDDVSGGSGVGHRSSEVGFLAPFRSTWLTAHRTQGLPWQSLPRTVRQDLQNLNHSPERCLSMIARYSFAPTAISSSG
jgi:hypothetical protein